MPLARDGAGGLPYWAGGNAPTVYESNPFPEKPVVQEVVISKETQQVAGRLTLPEVIDVIPSL